MPTFNDVVALVRDVPMDRALLVIVLAALGLVGYSLRIVLSVIKSTKEKS